MLGGLMERQLQWLLSYDRWSKQLAFAEKVGFTYCELMVRLEDDRANEKSNEIEVHSLCCVIRSE